LQYIQDVKSGAISVEDFISSTLDRIKSIDDKLHAFLDVYNNSAIDNARQIDKKIKSGDDNIGKCFGMPISIKDNICIKDSKTTCASEMLKDFVAPYDATVISKLKKQDATLIGKTNLDEFAMGLSTEFSAFGPSKNPWNLDYVPGGSSGGSAVSVSACECIASLGSDTGGSVRNPASFCGVVGYKPTYGLVSRYGLISYANSIEQIGPITRTVEDCAFLLDIISGHDSHDNTTVPPNHNVDFLSNISDGIEGKKIGLIKDMVGDGIDSAVLSATNDAISNLEGVGATCEEVSLDMIKYSIASYYTITTAEAGSNLARYDNLRYGYDYPVEGYEFNSYITKVRQKFGPEVTRRIILGGFVPSAGYAGKYLLKALKVKSKLTQEINDAFSKYDFLISPTVPILPFKIGEKIDDPIALFLIDINTVTANLTGCPAISVPFTTSKGLPIGIQLFGKPLGDKELFQAAYALQNTTKLPKVPIL
jgi:aspartyl-tRNA(Asn)/glutamyl-tRNA(Gln) amidotransferase subunit A